MKKQQVFKKWTGYIFLRHDSYLLPNKFQIGYRIPLTDHKDTEQQQAEIHNA